MENHFPVLTGLCDCVPSCNYTCLAVTPSNCTFTSWHKLGSVMHLLPFHPYEGLCSRCGALCLLINNIWQVRISDDPPPAMLTGLTSNISTTDGLCFYTTTYLSQAARRIVVRLNFFAQHLPPLNQILSYTQRKLRGAEHVIPFSERLHLPGIYHSVITSQRESDIMYEAHKNIGSRCCCSQSDDCLFLWTLSHDCWVTPWNAPVLTFNPCPHHTSHAYSTHPPPQRRVIFGGKSEPWKLILRG